MSFAFSLNSNSGSSTSKKDHSSHILINGAGGSFPYPLYSEWFYRFNELYPNVRINYQSIGSGAGIRQLLVGTIDFGATDIPMKDSELERSNAKILHIPMALGAVVLSYNLPEIVKNEYEAETKDREHQSLKRFEDEARLRLTGEIIAEIYLGQITKWNDIKIQRENPKMKFPDLKITPIYRSEGSGTTAIFTQYLSKISKEWKERAGTGKSIKWPYGVGGKGNEGVSGLTRHIPGSIGFMEWIYAKKNNFQIAEIQNQEGHFVSPSYEGLLSASYHVSIPSDFRVDLTNAKGRESYPLSAYTYILLKGVDERSDKKTQIPDPPKIYFEKSNLQKLNISTQYHLYKFIKWAYEVGEDSVKKLGYAPVPKEIQKEALKKIQMEAEK